MSLASSPASSHVTGDDGPCFEGDDGPNEGSVLTFSGFSGEMG